MLIIYYNMAPYTIASGGFMTEYTLDSSEICALREIDARLAFVIQHYGELTYTQHSGSFEHIAENILGQMLSSKLQM